MRVMIGFLVQGRVRIKIKIRVRVGVTFNVSVYHWSNCPGSKCRTFHGSVFSFHYNFDSFCITLFKIYNH